MQGWLRTLGTPRGAKVRRRETGTAQHHGDTPGTPRGPEDAQHLGKPWGHPPFREGRAGTPTFLLATQQQLVFVSAGVVVALHLQPVIGLEALGVLAVPQELLVVALQAAQDLTHLLGRQRAELGGAWPCQPLLGPLGPLCHPGTPGELTVMCVQDWICWMSRVRYCQARRLRRSWCSCCHSPSSCWWVVSSLWGCGVRGGTRRSPGGAAGSLSPPVHGIQSLLVGGRQEEADRGHDGLTATGAHHPPLLRLRVAHQGTGVVLVHRHLRGRGSGWGGGPCVPLCLSHIPQCPPIFPYGAGVVSGWVGGSLCPPLGPLMGLEQHERRVRGPPCLPLSPWVVSDQRGVLQCPPVGLGQHQTGVLDPPCLPTLPHIPPRPPQGNQP